MTALAIAPETSDTLSAGRSGSGVFKSTDGGASWNAVNTGLPNYPYVLTVAIGPQMPATLYAGTDVGVFKSTDGGGGWGSVNAGLTACSVNVLTIDAQMPATLYAGTDIGVAKSS